MTDVDVGRENKPAGERTGPSGVLPPLMALGLSLRSGDGYAVQGVSFSVRAGELALIIGTAGSGHRACMEMVSGRVRPSFGTVTVCGQPLTQGMRTLGIAASPARAAELTGREWLCQQARPAAGTVEEAGERVDATVSRLKLSRTADRPVTTLDRSGIRMLSVASALSTMAPVMVLDEPSADLDDAGEDAVMAAAAEARDAGSAVLVSATCGQIPRAAFDRVFVLLGGHLRYAGTGRDVWSWATALYTHLGRGSGHHPDGAIR